MDNKDKNPLEDGLVYVGSIPVSWGPRGDVFPDNSYTRITEHNEHVLRCANLLGEQIRDRVEDESETDLALTRLEAKVNLLLELVSKLDQRTEQIPGLAEVRLAATSIEWKCQDSPPGIGDNVWVNIHLDNRIPEAMKIAARVLTVREDAHGAIVCAEFEFLGGVVQDQMEKMIFRHHRRRIAQSRSG